MTAPGLLQIGLYLGVLLALVKPLGLYMARVYEGKPCGLDRALGWLERGLYRLCGVKPDDDMGWKSYALAVLVFNMAGALVFFLLQRRQPLLPPHPADTPAVSPGTGVNTGVPVAANP